MSCALGSGMRTYGGIENVPFGVDGHAIVKIHGGDPHHGWSPRWRGWTVLWCWGGAQDATNRAMSEQTAGMATEKHGRDDVSSEYPDGFLQAVEIPTAGGGQRWLKEEVGWLRAPTPPPPSRTIPRFGRRYK